MDSCSQSWMKSSAAGAMPKAFSNTKLKTQQCLRWNLNVRIVEIRFDVIDLCSLCLTLVCLYSCRQTSMSTQSSRRSKVWRSQCRGKLFKPWSSSGRKDSTMFNWYIRPFLLVLLPEALYNSSLIQPLCASHRIDILHLYCIFAGVFYFSSAESVYDENYRWGYWWKCRRSLWLTVSYWLCPSH